MKELVFRCDICMARGQATVASRPATAVQIGSTAPLLIDLCQADYDELLDPVIQALAKYGYKDEPPKKTRKKTGTSA